MHNRFIRYAIAYLIWLSLLFTCTGGFHDTGEWFWSWEEWDADWYEQIWEDGYRYNLQALAFPPGFSLLIGIVSEITSLPFNFAAMAANLLFFFVGSIIAAELLAEAVNAQRLGIFILSLTSPAAYFTLAPYSDALFFPLLWGALFLAVKNVRRMSFVLLECGVLMLAPWVRIAGFALLSWLIVRRWRAAVIFISLAGWLWLNYHISGDALYFIKAQELYHMPDGNFFQGIYSSVYGIFFNTGQFKTSKYLAVYVLPVLYLLILLPCAIWYMARKQWIMAITMIGMLALSHNQAFWRSCVRYDLPLMPFLYAALLANGDTQKTGKGTCKAGIIAIIGLVQFSLQIYFARNFMGGNWAF